MLNDKTSKVRAAQEEKIFIKFFPRVLEKSLSKFFTPPFAFRQAICNLSQEGEMSHATSGKRGGVSLFQIQVYYGNGGDKSAGPTNSVELVALPHPTVPYTDSKVNYGV